MKFGPVPVAEAEGAILAHSLHLSGGRLRKGVRLTAEHVATLRDAGQTEITVARLEPGDVHEDAAALALAEAAAEGASSLHLSAPFTGRVNLIADRPGVVVLDPDKVIAANEVDPMITVACVPACHQVLKGGMIATIKIISYAVSEAALAEACARIRGALGLAVPVHGSASLIITDIPGGPGDKGRAAIEARLGALDMRLEELRLCAHDDAALAGEIAAATGDLVLILTGSATSDLRDTAPEALRMAGGKVTRFGIPVDPGNLLFLGELGEKPVIGLPGSARSPVLHGADWVLARVACGLEISPRDFAAMGVGGLLKEIPTRPQPRRG
ncbi:molybdopterin biosynthesis protein [Roseovarius faecimaris]|uniref:Molybdopterin biosynthesis protein n=1 Tax=Roseovarius faecimaris TaxID=2494550 RepID=A0A6I6IM71_9RHOB|nr:molybdopterin-binding protein [Roseovarius faecimaris]QGX98069.1 molybdopterin biosynthesis protein [Roseovarius faecimaris]